MLTACENTLCLPSSLSSAMLSVTETNSLTYIFVYVCVIESRKTVPNHTFLFTTVT